MENSVTGPGASEILRLLQNVDLPAFFTALPEDELQKIIDHRLEQIEDRLREIAAARESVANWQREIDAVRLALKIKRDLAGDPNGPRKAPVETGALAPGKISRARQRVALRRKQDAVLRV